MSGHIVLVLKTNTPSNLAQENGQRKVITWLQSKKIKFKEIDAVDQKDVREELTTLSGVKGNYPQVFITDQASETKFVGQFEKIQELIESDDIPADVLEKNPGIDTFSRVFEKCKE